MKTPWKWLCENTTKPVFAAVVFAFGVIVWGGFNAAMEATNTLTFCISCHEMRDNVYEEYTQTAHYKNHGGVRAICSDCHVPKSWGHKVVRKIKATNELFHWAIGSIDTPKKFEAKRLELARTVWTEMKNNGSRECKNCHAFDAMHWKKQSLRAMVTMQTAQQKDLACIECHKGVAHKLPDFYAYYDQLTESFEDQVSKDTLRGPVLTATAFKRLYADKDTDAVKLLDVMPLTSFQVVERDGDWLKLRLEAWNEYGKRTLYKQAGRHMEIALLSSTGQNAAQQRDEYQDEKTKTIWSKVAIEGWTTGDKLASDRKLVETYVEELWRTECNVCHNLNPPDRYNAGDWVKPINAMREKSKLKSMQLTMILKYLQDRAKDMTGDATGAN